MKKKNWLMTIAFAVLALTIVSTCVIGSTYAKFTSKVDGGAKVQAAGFQIGTASELTLTSEVIKPGKQMQGNVTVTYFSQVATEVTASSVTYSGTGALADWDSIISAYNALHTTDNLGVGSLTIDKVFVVTIGSGTTTTLANDFATAVAAATGADTAGIGGIALVATNNKITAMKADATAALNVTLTLKVKWADNYITESAGTDENVKTAQQIMDSFDTYLGNLIATYATTAANSEAPQSYLTVGIPLTISQDTTVA